MKAVLMSIKPEWCEKIASGKKTIEVRKNRPKLKVPFKSYIYETKAINHNKLIVDLDGDLPTVFAKGRGKVIGEFVCDRIDRLVHSGTCRQDKQLTILNSDLSYSQLTKGYLRKTCLTLDEIEAYSKGGDFYAWHITNLVIYDEPKELNEFTKECPSDNCWECPHSISSDPRYFYETKIVGCRNNVKRPPQSWCYVEEESK